jgi:hypothetical protein
MDELAVRRPARALLVGAFGWLLLYVLHQPATVQSQEALPVYWRYDAPGSLNQVIVADVDRDGDDEFVVVAGQSSVMLVGSDGRPRWVSPFQVEQTITAVTAINTDGGLDPARELAVGAEQELILLDGRGARLWQRQLPQTIRALGAYSDPTGDWENLVVALSNGRLLALDGSGSTLWEYSFTDLPADNAQPRLTVVDLERNGDQRIVYSYFAADGFSKLVVANSQGSRLWESSNSGTITDLTIVDFDVDAPLEIAVGTNLGQVHLYNSDGVRRWPYRTVNKPVTVVEMLVRGDTRALIVGTEVGALVAFDHEGRRLWTEHYFGSPDRPVVAISASSTDLPSGQPVAIAVTFASGAGSTEPPILVLLDAGGRRLEPSYSAVDPSGIARIVDINRDGHSELLLARFATLELLDPGVGARQYSEAWDYRLGAQPGAIVAEDIDRDGEQEVLIGTNDGRVHALENNGTPLWVVDLGGAVSHLAIADGGSASPPEIVVAHNEVVDSVDGGERFESHVTVLRPDGRVAASTGFSSSITSLAVGNINRSGPSEIVIGTSDGLVVAQSLRGEEHWRVRIGAAANYLTLVSGTRGVEVLVGSSTSTVGLLNHKGSGYRRISSYQDELLGLTQIPRAETQPPMLVVALGDGTLRGLNTQGVELWQRDLEGIPQMISATGSSVLASTDEQNLLHLDARGTVLWRSAEVGRVTSLYWGDLDGDVQPDVAVGTREGTILLLTGDGREMWGILNLAGEVSHVSAFRGLPGELAEMIAVTGNGIVQLFRSQANRPPLLINPQTEVSPGNYSITVNVIDVERDRVTVTLEVLDPSTQGWFSQGSRVAASGSDTLFWLIDAPDSSTAVHYRFIYDDGVHQGIRQALVGPAPMGAGPSLGFALTVTLALFAIGGLVIVVFRQTRAAAAQSKRLYQRIAKEPDILLGVLESEYRSGGGSPDLLLNLASEARQENNRPLADLADGLFLLPSRPESALPIMVGALEDMSALSPEPRDRELWSRLFRTVTSLLTAQSITELTLLMPRLERLIGDEATQNGQVSTLRPLHTILTTLRDGERVDLARDRLAYLGEAESLLAQQQIELTERPASIERALKQVLVERWLGLVLAEIEEIQGRAQIVVNLITRRLAPEQTTTIALDLKNVGRAAAENVLVALDEDPSWTCSSGPAAIKRLLPGRNRQVQFQVEAHVPDQFRPVFTIQYDDTHGAGRRIAFADMVHFLPPVRDFRPIPNPYSPGMPLRRNSLVFFGREDLFRFISENADELTQRNVLILVGQRRTGKTSALLQLGYHVPDHMFPIYIDCQSLGVVPGMAAFFHDLAWVISDAFAERGLELQVDLPEIWQSDPGGKFQRHFLPSAQALLPQGTTMLLMFDEFEVFESLVGDGMLPPTLFTYLRHLMQHGKGMAFIFAGTSRLEEMGSDYWSVLFNIALYRQIGFLDGEAAQRLIREPVAPDLTYDDLAVDKILRMTAGHPYFLQLVCYSLVNRANQERTGYVTISNVNAALDEMLRLGEVHFAYLWLRSTQAERALLAAAGRLMDSDSPWRLEDLLNYLEEYNIRLEPGEATEAIGRLIDREIIRETAGSGPSRYELRIGLVGLWVAQNKSLMSLYRSRDLPEPVQPPTSSGQGRRTGQGSRLRIARQHLRKPDA